MLKTDRAVLLKEGMGSHLRVILFHSRYLRHDKALVKERFSESISLSPRWTSAVHPIIH